MMRLTAEKSLTISSAVSAVWIQNANVMDRQTNTAGRQQIPCFCRALRGKNWTIKTKTISVCSKHIILVTLLLWTFEVFTSPLSLTQAVRMVTPSLNRTCSDGMLWRHPLNRLKSWILCMSYRQCHFSKTGRISISTSLFQVNNLKATSWLTVLGHWVTFREISFT